MGCGERSLTESSSHNQERIVPGSPSPSTSHLKSADDNESTEIPRTGLRKSLLRRSSSEISCYIIDHTPEFSDEHKNIVINAWHFITDHISEAGMGAFIEFFKISPDAA